MNRIIRILSVICLAIFSCKKEADKNLMYKEQLLAKHPILKGEEPKDAFVFCLDTVKTTLEYGKLNDEFCKKKTEEPIYLYLSTYDVYFPIYMRYRCDSESYYGCSRRILDFVVNKNKQWLIDNELAVNFDQQVINTAFFDYYSDFKANSIKVSFNAEIITDNEERDSLYMSLLSGYKYLIDREVMKRKKNSIDLYKKCPLIIFFGDDLIIEPKQQFPIEETKNASR